MKKEEALKIIKSAVNSDALTVKFKDALGLIASGYDQNEQELKQYAIEFAEWMHKNGYAPLGDNRFLHSYTNKTTNTAYGCSSNVSSGDQIYQQFLDSKLSDVERFRRAVIKHIIDYYDDASGDYWTLDNTLKLIEEFNTTTE